MPELPEVEVARIAVEDHCLGKKIVRAIIANDSTVIAGVSPADFEASLLGKTILAACRKGKNMWLQLDSPPFPTFQFGMAGALYIKGVAVTTYKRSAVNNSDEWPSKYSKFFVKLDDGLELSFTDKRRFAKVRLLEDPTSVPPISELGPDALSNPMTADEFFNSVHDKKIGIKALLLDQSFTSGIGNWIADEVLYQVKIHPQQPASTLTKETCAELVRCIKEVIQYAVEVDADCNRFPKDWIFHFRWGKKPGNIEGKKIDFIKAGGRTTAYVPELQKLSEAQVSKASGEGGKRSSERNKDLSAVDGGSDDGHAEHVKMVDSKPQNKKVGLKKPSGRKKPAKNDDESNSGKEDSGNEKKDKAPAKRKSRQRTEKEDTKSLKKTRGNNKKASSVTEGDDNADGNDKGNHARAGRATKTNAVTRSTKR